MKQEDKELLLRDLCARIPYNVRMHEINPINNIQLEIFLGSVTCESNIAVKTKNKGIMCGAIEEFKPYLFPMSSMNKEQKREYHQSTSKDIDILQDVILERINGKDNNNKHAIAYNGIDWLNAHHFDYRGLIAKGLAIDATGLNIY